MIIACNRCGLGMLDQGLTCPRCGAPTPIARDRAARWRRIGLVTLLIITVLGVFFGSYRIVRGVPGLIVRRTTLGFDNAISSVDICRANDRAPVDTTRLLCVDLDAAGVLSNVVQAGRPRR
jgi:hypothetical protein